MRRRRLALGLALVAALAGVMLLARCAGPVPSYSGGVIPSSPATFVVYGDSQRTLIAEFWRSQNDSERNRVSDAIVAERPDLIVNCGDLVAYGADASHWRRFHADNQAIWSSRIPYFPAVGNHEYYGANGRALSNFHTFFPCLEGRTWYVVRAGNVLIVILNSNFDELVSADVAAQDAWLGSTLAAAETDASLRHVLVCFHHPPYTNARLLDDSIPAQNHFIPRLTPKVKVVACGHVHTYERFLKSGVQFVVTGGGGGPAAELDANSPRHPDEYAGATRGFHYLRFRIEDVRLLCDVLMLQPDRTFARVDGFECR